MAQMLDGLRALRDIQALNEIEEPEVPRRKAPRVYYPRLNEWAVDDAKFKHKYRLPKAVVREVIEMVTPGLQRATLSGHAIPVDVQVLGALRYYMQLVASRRWLEN